GNEEDRGGVIVRSFVMPAEITALELCDELGVCIEHDLLIAAQPASQPRKVDDDSTFCHLQANQRTRFSRRHALARRRLTEAPPSLPAALCVGMKRGERDRRRSSARRRGRAAIRERTSTIARRTSPD